MKVMEQGLKNFKETAAYVLTFNNPKIKRVKLTDTRDPVDRQEAIFEIIRVKPIVGGLNLVTVANGNTTNLRYFIEQKDNIAHLVLEVASPV